MHTKYTTIFTLISITSLCPNMLMADELSPTQSDQTSTADSSNNTAPDGRQAHMKERTQKRLEQLGNQAKRRAQQHDMMRKQMAERRTYAEKHNELLFQQTLDQLDRVMAYHEQIMTNIKQYKANLENNKESLLQNASRGYDEQEKHLEQLQNQLSTYQAELMEQQQKLSAMSPDEFSTHLSEQRNMRGGPSPTQNASQQAPTSYQSPTNPSSSNAASQSSQTPH